MDVGVTPTYKAGGYFIVRGSGTGSIYTTSDSGVDWPSPRFIDNGDQTLSDELTGLIWAKDGNLMNTRNPDFDYEGIQDGKVSWGEAFNYISYLNSIKYMGYEDWRLPNREELLSVVAWSQARGDIWLITQKFINLQATSYWTSTTDIFDTTKAWTVTPASGFSASYSKTSYNFFWPVRGDVAAMYPLTVEFAGSGSGAVNGALACESGTVCDPISFALGTNISLIAAANESSTFEGWSGDCAGTGTCNIDMNYSRKAIATFNLAPKAKLSVDSTTGYDTLSEAYSNAISDIFSINLEFPGDLTLTTDKNIYLHGGYRSDYKSQSGFTFIKGKLCINNGSLIVDGVKVIEN